MLTDVSTTGVVSLALAQSQAARLTSSRGHALAQSALLASRLGQSSSAAAGPEDEETGTPAQQQSMMDPMDGETAAALHSSAAAGLTASSSSDALASSRAISGSISSSHGMTIREQVEAV